MDAKLKPSGKGGPLHVHIQTRIINENDLEVKSINLLNK